LLGFLVYAMRFCFEDLTLLRGLYFIDS